MLPAQIPGGGGVSVLGLHPSLQEQKTPKTIRSKSFGHDWDEAEKAAPGMTTIGVNRDKAVPTGTR